MDRGAILNTQYTCDYTHPIRRVRFAAIRANSIITTNSVLSASTSDARGRTAAIRVDSQFSCRMQCAGKSSVERPSEALNALGGRAGGPPTVRRPPHTLATRRQSAACDAWHVRREAAAAAAAAEVPESLSESLSLLESCAAGANSTAGRRLVITTTFSSRQRPPSHPFPPTDPP